MEFSKEMLGQLLRETARILPGIQSYQDRESFRDADKKLRMLLSRQLEEMRSTLEKMKTSLAYQKEFLYLKPLDDLTRQIDQIGRTLLFAARGYTGVFATERVDEKVLTELFAFDASLKEDLVSLSLPIAELARKKSDGQLSTLLNEIQKALNHLEQKLSKRDQILKGV